jgi:excinuclease ABC subunit A
MDFLSDVAVVCDQCKGLRYREEVLACRFRGRNIAQVLALTAHEAAAFFDGHRALSAGLEMLEKVGLGYLQLGQPLNTLSGGEAQRLVLGAELARPASGKSLYLFDEPSTGLHFRDIERLLALFHQLADRGHTLLMIEHDPQMIAHADWIIDLGPEGGDEGGHVVASGRLQEIMENDKSVTGKWLRDHIRF